MCKSNNPMSIGPLWANNDVGTVYLQGHLVIPNNINDKSNKYYKNAKDLFGDAYNKYIKLVFLK